MIALILTHFVADFIFQTDKMAINKSKSNKWLFFHVFVYSLPLLFWGWKFAAFNAVAHFLVDYVTSRLTTHLWNKNECHWFFVVIGADQALHLTCLFLSYELIGTIF